MTIVMISLSPSRMAQLVDFSEIPQNIENHDDGIRIGWKSDLTPNVMYLAISRRES
jgi:hypothetical protein